MSEHKLPGYVILEEHAQNLDHELCATIKVRKGEEDAVEIRVIKMCITESSRNAIKQEDGIRYFLISQGMEEELDLEEAMDCLYTDFFLIARRMIRDLQGRYSRSRYDILQKRTRMVQNLYSKIPESEIEIAFMDGEHYYLFSYESDSFVEYGICRVSWIDQEEDGYQVDRDTDIIESYDSLQESLSSDFAGLFLELHEMMCNAENFPDELFEEYEEEELPGYYAYEE